MRVRGLSKKGNPGPIIQTLQAHSKLSRQLLSTRSLYDAESLHKRALAIREKISQRS
jgi:hypothetical protein